MFFHHPSSTLLQQILTKAEKKQLDPNSVQFIFQQYQDAKNFVDVLLNYEKLENPATPDRTRTIKVISSGEKGQTSYAVTLATEEWEKIEQTHHSLASPEIKMRKPDKKNYIIVNIWPSEENKNIPGCNVGHVSLQTRFINKDNQIVSEYISLWPGPRPDSQYVDEDARFAKIRREMISYFGKRSNSFKPNYSEDCLSEAFSELKECMRAIIDPWDCKENEIPYIFNKDSVTFRQFNPKDSLKLKEGSEYLIAVRLIKAQVRLVLYTLDVEKIITSFRELKNNIGGWRLIGSNFLTRNFSTKTVENCASLAYRCLKAGGLYEELPVTHSSQASSVTTPDLLIKHVMDYKALELKVYSGTGEWKCEDCPDETSLDTLPKQLLNAEEEINRLSKSFRKK